MQQIRLTKCFTFDMAHAITGYEGKCRNIHGHTYHMEVCVKGVVAVEPGSSDGMVMDFAVLKHMVEDKIVNKYDHALVLEAATNVKEISVLRAQYDKIITYPCVPTTENILLNMVEELRSAMPSHVELYSVKLAETETSYATWYRNDNI